MVSHQEKTKSWFIWTYFDGDEDGSKNYVVECRLLNGEKEEERVVYKDAPIPLDRDPEQVSRVSTVLSSNISYITKKFHVFCVGQTLSVFTKFKAKFELYEDPYLNFTSVGHYFSI